MLIKFHLWLRIALATRNIAVDNLNPCCQETYILSEYTHKKSKQMGTIIHVMLNAMKKMANKTQLLKW